LKLSVTADDQAFHAKKSNDLLQITRAETNLEPRVPWGQKLRETSFAMPFRPIHMCLWGLEVAWAADWRAAAFFLGARDSTPTPFQRAQLIRQICPAVKKLGKAANLGSWGLKHSRKMPSVRTWQTR
jgi:hypothetical protein